MMDKESRPFRLSLILSLRRFCGETTGRQGPGAEEKRIMLLRKEFKFEAAHNLVRYHGKCERLHGHTYRLAVLLEGTPDGEGMIMDFCELSSIVKERVIAVLDHSYLNDTIPQPTAENIALWTWRRIEAPLQRPNCRLFEVRVWETASNGVVLRASDPILTEEGGEEGRP